MVPVWAKAKDGKWVVFPVEILMTREDGRQAAKTDSLSLEKLGAFLRATKRPMRYYFAWNKDINYWILRNEDERRKRRKRR